MKKRILMSAASLLIVFSILSFQPLACILPGLSQVVNADSYSSITSDSQFRDALANGGHYRIDTDTLSVNDDQGLYTYAVAAGKDVVIDLNGHNIKLTSKNGTYNSGIRLESGSTLTITGKGSFVSNASTTNIRPLFDAKSGTSTLNLEADAEFTNMDGYIAFIRDGATLNLNISNGRYSHSSKSQVSGYFDIANGGTLNASFTGGYFDQDFSNSYVASGYKKISDSTFANYDYAVIKDEAVVTKAPEALKLNWTGEDQALVTAGTATNGTMMYSLTENGEYSADIPVASEIGEYTVYYKAVGTAPTVPSEVASVTSTIKKSVNLSLTASDKEFDDEAYSDYVLESGAEDVTVSFRVAGSTDALDSAPSAVGNYEIRAVIEETETCYGASTEWIPFAINEIALHYTAPKAITGLIYNRSAQELVTPGTSDHHTTMEYALGVAPKAYTQEDGYGNGNPVNINVEDLNPDDVLVIGRGGYCIWNGTVTVIKTPDGETLSNSTKSKVADLYKDASGSLYYSPFLPSSHMPAATWDSTYGYNSFKVVSREGRNVTITPYKLMGEVEDTRVWSSKVPTAISGGTYKVAWRITASDEVDGLDEHIIEVTIGQADPTYVITAKKSILPYTGENQALVNVEGYGGQLYFKKFTTYNGSYISVGEFKPEIPEGRDATEYMISYYSDEDENYKALGSESNCRSLYVTIGKADNSCTPPEPVEGLVYDGKNHDLVTAGTAEYGTMIYSLEQDGTYSGDIPVGCDAGTYTVWYKVEGDEGYTSIEPQSVEVTIGKMPIVVTLATGNEYVWGTWVTPYERFSVANVPDSVYEELKDAIAKCINIPQTSPNYYNVDTSANDPAVYTYGINQYRVDTFNSTEAYSNYVLSFANTQGSFTITPYDLNNIAQYGDRAATITYGEREFTYDGGNHRPTVTVLVPYDKTDTTTGEVERLSSNMHINYDGSYQTQVGGYSTIATVTNCEGSLEITWSIVEADPEFTAPTGNRLIYNGSEQQLVTAGTTQHGNFLYALDGTPLRYEGNWELYASDLRVGDVLHPTTYLQGIRLYNGTFIMGGVEMEGEGYVCEFCLKNDENIVIYDPDGKFVASWDLNIYNSLKVTKIEGDTVTMAPFKYVEGEDENLASWDYLIPTRSALGEYTVRYMVEGDWNHKDSRIGSVEAVIREEQITDITDLAGYTLSLEGDIGVKFYVAMKDELIASPNAQMVFTVPEGNKTTTQIVKVSDVVGKVTPMEIGGVSYYPFKCTVSAKDMASVIKAQMMSDDVAGDVYEFTVKGYADYLLANPDKFPEFEKASNLVKAMLNYGAAAQVYFGVEGTGPANSSLSTEDKNLSNVDVPYSAEANYLPDGVTFAGASLSTKTKMTLSLYFTGAENATFMYGGEEIEPEIIGGYQVIRINDLNANKISGGYTVFVNGSHNYITYSPKNYCYKVVSSSSYGPELKNLCKAIYKYAEEADTYFAQQG